MTTKEIIELADKDHKTNDKDYNKGMMDCRKGYINTEEAKYFLMCNGIQK